MAKISYLTHMIISKPITDSVAHQYFTGLIVAEHKAYIFHLKLDVLEIIFWLWGSHKLGFKFVFYLWMNCIKQGILPSISNDCTNINDVVITA